MLLPSELEHERRRIAEAQSGSEQAWRALFDEYYPRLYAFMRARVTDPHTADDLAAETFVDAFRGLPRFRWRGTPFGAWLFKVARNRLRMHYRSARRDTDSLSALGSSEPSLTVDHGLALDIEATLRGLPREYREAIELRYVLGLTGPEAAAAMGRSHGAFRMLLHRATTAFREAYGDEPTKFSMPRDSRGDRRIPMSEPEAFQAEGGSTR